MVRLRYVTRSSNKDPDGLDHVPPEPQIATLLRMRSRRSVTLTT